MVLVTSITAATTRQCRRGGVASVMTSRTLTTTSGASCSPTKGDRVDKLKVIVNIAINVNSGV